jgi:hypothetical protein
MELLSKDALNSLREKEKASKHGKQRLLKISDRKTGNASSVALYLLPLLRVLGQTSYRLSGIRVDYLILLQDSLSAGARKLWV